MGGMGGMGMGGGMGMMPPQPPMQAPYGGGMQMPNEGYAPPQSTQQLQQPHQQQQQQAQFSNLIPGFGQGGEGGSMPVLDHDKLQSQ